MAISNYLKNKLLEHTVKNTAYTSPTTVYISLHTANDATSGEPSTEVTGGGYARQAVAFGASSNGVISNTGNVTFTASGADFGSVISSAISDASTGGNILFYDDFVVEIVDGDSVVLEAGDISITLE